VVRREEPVPQGRLGWLAQQDHKEQLDHRELLEVLDLLVLQVQQGLQV
jgi:hypothetical protein